MTSATSPQTDLWALLSGGDRRSIGRADEVVALVLTRPERFSSLLLGMQSADPVLKARCADAAEKISAVHPEWLIPHKALLIEQLSRDPQPEVRWHVAPMLARLPLDRTELAQLVTRLTEWLGDASSIVKTMSMQALAVLAERHEALRPEVLRHLRELTVIGTPAMKARGRKLLKRLDRRER